jgi:hypothetical protein
MKIEPLQNITDFGQIDKHLIKFDFEKDYRLKHNISIEDFNTYIRKKIIKSIHHTYGIYEKNNLKGIFTINFDQSLSKAINYNVTNISNLYIEQNESPEIIPQIYNYIIDNFLHTDFIRCRIFGNDYKSKGAFSNLSFEVTANTTKFGKKYTKKQFYYRSFNKNLISIKYFEESLFTQIFELLDEHEFNEKLKGFPSFRPNILNLMRIWIIERSYNSIFLVAQCNLTSKIVGFIGVRDCSDFNNYFRTDIYAFDILMVKKEYRRKGIAHCLINSVFNHYEKTEMELENTVLDENISVFNFFLKFGSTKLTKYIHLQKTLI